MLEKLYVEITNRCNLRCSFCPPTLRAPQTVSLDLFAELLERIRGAARVLYFHLKGEPLLHPDVGECIEMAGDAGFAVRLTTNGTLLPERVEELRARSALERLNVSLHSLEDMAESERSTALRRILAAVAVLRGADPERRRLKTISLRLWNRTDAARTDLLIGDIEAFFGREPGSLAASLVGARGAVIESGISVHPAERFAWPDPAAAARIPPPDAVDPDSGYCRGTCRGTCRALQDQAGILADGTVVPCCLDGEGTIALGNVYAEPLDRILESPRARRLREGFRRRLVVEPLCATCGFRGRF